MAVSPDDLRLATAGTDRLIRLWNPADGCPGPILRGHADNVRAPVFAGDGRALASGGKDMTVRLWDLDRNREVQILHTPEYVIASAYLPHGNWFAPAGEGGKVGF